MGGAITGTMIARVILTAEATVIPAGATIFTGPIGPVKDAAANTDGEGSARGAESSAGGGTSTGAEIVMVGGGSSTAAALVTGGGATLNAAANTDGEGSARGAENSEGAEIVTGLQGGSMTTTVTETIRAGSTRPTRGGAHMTPRVTPMGGGKITETHGKTGAEEREATRGGNSEVVG